MTGIECLNLCEILSYIVQHYSSLSKFSEELPYKDFRRIYIGSYFCFNQFFHSVSAAKKWFFDECRGNSLKITLVVPVFPEHMLEKAVDVICSLCNENSDIIDELTVNDYGMLEMMSGKASISLNIGRLMVKYSRDNRYQELLHRSYDNGFCTDWIKELAIKYGIRCFEYDNTHGVMNISNSIGVIPALHFPYCYETVGIVCEFASVNRQITSKFRAEGECLGECTETFSYCILPEKQEVIKIGKTVYFRNDLKKLSEIDKNYRLIYTPFDLCTGMNAGRIKA